MENTSRQAQAFERWKQDFLRLLQRDKTIDPGTRKDIQAFFADFFANEGICNNMIQAFSNFMWTMDEQIEQEVNIEIKRVAALVPLLTDPENPDIISLQKQLLEIAATGKIRVDDMGTVEINKLVPDDEFDDSKPAGL